MGVRGAYGSAAALMLGADQTPFRAWISLCAIDLVRFPAVLMEAQWQGSQKLLKGVKVIAVLFKMLNQDFSLYLRTKPMKFLAFWCACSAVE